ncbi:MAG: ABC transporter ATP-binding protein [Verrucomicrobia bacterium]|nr:ABC transporter ATP-binding protein [Verrucomicrobiota bacterium]
MPLLEIRNLRIDFGAHRVVDEVSLSLDAGKTYCLVGESGCGKSVTALSIARLLATPPASHPRGQILLEGHDVLSMNPRELQRIRGGHVGYVFQEPGASLNPVMRIGTQIREALTRHRPQFANDAEVIRLLRQVGIPAPETRLKDYPHQLSGGMQQRVMIAMALAPQPKLLIADEPTTALDVTVQAQIIELLRDLQQQLGMSILLITHNLGLVGDIADRVGVMYAGQIVEEGQTRDVLQRPRHPYTRALLKSVPELGRAGRRLESIPGTVPRPGDWPVGCRFAPRCPMARSECSLRPIDWNPGSIDHAVRCPYADA